jgi:hypothetical protein
MQMENYIQIATFSNEIEARLAQATLSAANIESFVHSDDVGGMLPSLEQSEGVQLLVDKTTADEAKVLLSSASTPTHDEENKEGV